MNIWKYYEISVVHSLSIHFYNTFKKINITNVKKNWRKENIYSISILSYVYNAIVSETGKKLKLHFKILIKLLIFVAIRLA